MSARLTPYLATTFSAVWPMLTYDSGMSTTRPGCGLMRKPVIGTRLIDSTPPATITSAPPVRIRSHARAIACSPDEQKRLIVIPGTV